nr:hypothetical protein [Haloprofundus salilacus]
MTANATAGTQWAETNCPRGPNREFGPCESVGDIVVQERAGDAVVVAVSLDVRVTTDCGRIEMTRVVTV